MIDHKKLRNLQHVRRFNFHQCNRYQSVAEHSFYVIMYAIQIVRAMFKTGGKRLQYLLSLVTDWAMWHDAEESITGDIPFLVRRALDAQALSDLEKKAREELGIKNMQCESSIITKDDLCKVWDAVRLADAIELKLYLQEERRSGNMNLVDIESETYTRIRELHDFAGMRIPDDLMLLIEDVGYSEFPENMSH